MPKPRKPTLQIPHSSKDEDANEIHLLVQRLLANGTVGDRAAALRGLASPAAEAHFHAPYRAEPSLFFVLVMGNGNILTINRQALFFESAVPLLPLSLAFSEKKRVRLGNKIKRLHPEEPRYGARFRDQWLLHGFSSWPRDSHQNSGLSPADLITLGTPEQSIGDRQGVSRKFVRLGLKEPKGHRYIIERLKLMRNDILRPIGKENLHDRTGSGTDHADFDMIIPSINARFYILVDLDIFQDRSLRQRAKVGHAIRLIGGPQWSRELPRYLRPEWKSGRRVEGTTTGDLIPELASICENAKSRAEEILKEDMARDESANTSPLLTKEAIDAIKPPKDCIFGRLDWPLPPLGLQVSLSWDISDIEDSEF